MTSSSSSSHADRRTFFRVLAVAALDILSRSLRRKSFVRAISSLLILQFVVVSLWWGALSVVLSVRVYDGDAIISKFAHLVWLLLALVSGKWATEIIVRLLGYVASGGVASWFGCQTVLIMDRTRKEEEVHAQNEERRKRHGQNSPQSAPTKVLETISENEDVITEDCCTPDNLFSGDDRCALFGGHDAMPEAYRTADASAYAPVRDFDEEFVRHDDDDDGDDDDGSEEHLESTIVFSNPTSMSNQQRMPSLSSSPTVKSFLTAGCTISFGSVAKCGLLGGLAQVLWSFVRNINAMGFFLRRFHPHSNIGSRGFRGMDISVDGSATIISPQRWKQTMEDWWRKVDVAIRCFVRNHSDLAMSHVAMYKSYKMAANDVAALIETSGTRNTLLLHPIHIFHQYAMVLIVLLCFFLRHQGVESIIHDDITTHLCSSVCHLASGLLAMFFGMVVVTHRNSFASNPLDDVSLLEILFVSYMLCHTMLFTALEPLRSAIKAVYVCFAEHPLSLSQAFPLIYQRLSRISEASNNL